MKNYIRPIAEVSKFDVADIITVSGEIVDAGALENNPKDLYEAYAAADGSSAYTNVAVFEW